MRDIILILHIVSSCMVCLMTLILLIRSQVALSQNLPVSKIDYKMPFYILLFLYFQLLMGMLLFYFLISHHTSNSLKIAEHGRYWMRFWAVEHFTLMIFTVVFAHIGYIYNKNTRLPDIIYRKNRLYFGITFILICWSMAMNIIR
jgi:hypothetical protein